MVSCLSLIVGMATSNWLANDGRIASTAVILLVIIWVFFGNEKKIKWMSGWVMVFFIGVMYGGRLGENSLISSHWLEPVIIALAKVRDRLEIISGKLWSEPYSSLLSGILLGSKESMAGDLKQAFKITGVMHIVAVSGYNVSVVAAILQSLTRPLPRQIGFWGSLAAIGLFVILTGATASVVRAGIMGVLVIIARYISRRSISFNTLIVAVTLMALIKPSILVKDIGFQLSVAATYGLIVFSPVFEAMFKRRMIWRWLPTNIQEALVATLAAQVFTVPIILIYFGRLSLISPLVNVLIVPLVPLAMLAGFISLMVGWLWIVPGEIVGWLTWVFLAGIVKIAEVLATIPYASLVLPKSLYLLLVPYGILCLMTVRRRKIIGGEIERTAPS